MKFVNSDPICSANRPWLHFVPVEEIAAGKFNNPSEGKLIHRLSGSDMRTVDKLFQRYQDEFIFPSYFGHNWPAFYELMTSLDNVRSPVHLTVVEAADQLLADEPVEIKTLLRQLNNIGRDWSTQVGLSKEWGVGPVSFNTVLVADAVNMEKLELQALWRSVI